MKTKYDADYLPKLLTLKGLPKGRYICDDGISTLAWSHWRLSDKAERTLEGL